MPLHSSVRRAGAVSTREGRRDVGQKLLDSALVPVVSTAATKGQAVNFSQFEPLSISTVNPNLTDAYAMNYNLNIQRELPPMISSERSCGSTLRMSSAVNSSTFFSPWDFWRV